GIEVQKSYSADKLASFGAGLDKLQTRGAGDVAYLDVSLTTAGNTISAFQTGRTYQGGGLDFLGFDDGTRALSKAGDQATNGGFTALDSLSEEERNAVAMSFPNIFNLRDRALPPDLGISVSGGYSLDLPMKGTFGAAASLRYSSAWRQQERTQRSFSKRSDGTLQTRDELNESRTDYNASLGGLLTLEATWDKHRFQANTFVVHQAQQRAQLTTGRSNVSDELDVQSYLLNWIERFLIAQQLTGDNDFDLFKLQWRGMIAAASRDAPDQRNYAYAKAPDQDRYFARGDTGVARRYSTVDDLVASFGLDAIVPVVGKDKDWLKLTLKFGGAVEHSKRDALTQLFLWRVGETGDRSITDPEVLYDPTNTGDTINFQDLSNSGADDYAAIGNTYGVYGMGELGLGDALRVLSGVRWETSKANVETFQLASRDGSGEREVKNGGFEQTNLLPFVSATWQIIEEFQLRSAYSRTVSRPIFNELSESTFYDPDTGDQYIGKADLAPTRIDGFDMRAEWYPSATESLSLGGFVKLYQDPIETSFVQRAGTVSVSTFQNAKDARVLGLEVGGRIEFDRLQDWLGESSILEGLYLQTNLAILNSQVTLLEQGTATNVQRPLDGQASYVLNVQGGFNGEEHDVVVSFNQVGRRLFRAGSLDRPDVFLQAIPRLDITWTWRLRDWVSVRAGASNLVNPNITFKQGDEVWRQYKEGMTFRLTVNFGI
ncbi:MAG: TonB-dependent receptor, partial [Myxococcales bacterium]|nr:TonB-dependent receptor [Myxococcales bacterium]